MGTAKAKELNENLTSNDPNIEKYDGLVVVISCHGIEHHILSSDEKQIGKDVIHRIFSGKYAENRSIPRIFIFDSCAGSEEKDRGLSTSPIMQTQKTVNILDSNKAQRDSIKVPISWNQTEQNPDYRLMTIKASNYGFQSKMNSETGSYCISALYQMIKWNVVSKNNHYFLGELCNKIQTKLHEQCQLPVITSNNGTEYVKFKVNGSESTRDNETKFDFFRSKSRSEYLPMDQNDDNDHDDDEKSEWSIDRDPLDPVPVNVVKYDDMNGDIPALDKGAIAEIQMHQMEYMQSTHL